MNKYDAFERFLDASQKGDLVKSLGEAQRIWGYIPPEAEKQIADSLKLPLSYVVSVRSFYSYFYTDGPASYVIRVCKTGPCHVAGGKRLLDVFKEHLNIDAGECTLDGKYRLEAVGCLGLCDKAPAVVVNGNVFGPVKPSDVEEILKNLL